jgi:hypothetical protein
MARVKAEEMREDEDTRTVTLGHSPSFEPGHSDCGATPVARPVLARLQPHKHPTLSSQEECEFLQGLGGHPEQGGAVTSGARPGVAVGPLQYLGRG